jgi:hypothetical protein
MSGKTVFPVLTLCAFVCVFAGLPSSAEAAMPGFLRRGVDLFDVQGTVFPGAGDIPGLEPRGRLLTYRNQKFEDLYGTAGERYIQFGMTSLQSANYLYEGGNLSLEIVTLGQPIEAAGLFHYHRGKVLREPGEDLDVGAEGVLDTARGGRNLYFYRSSLFVKIVYSGKEPVPDLMPIARHVDGKLPTRYDDKPIGVEYIRIEGVNENTIGITPGFTFNINFLPASVWASAPGGGSTASDMFVITRNLDRDAQTIFSDYTSYLKNYADYIEEYEVGGRDYVKAVDPTQGRVVFTRYRNAVIIAARPDGYERGEVLIQRVMDKIDEVKGDEGERGGGGGREERNDGDVEDSDEEAGEKRGFRWNPFRRRK